MTLPVFGDPSNHPSIPEIRDISATSLPPGQLSLIQLSAAPYCRVVGSVEQAEDTRLANAFLIDLTSNDLAMNTAIAYGRDLVRWLRFLTELHVTVAGASRTEVRDLVRWLRQAPNPQRLRSQHSKLGKAGSTDPRTGKRHLPAGYSPATINRQLTVLHGFYEYLADEGVVFLNPVPSQQSARGALRIDRGKRAGKSPMEPHALGRRASLRQRERKATPRGVQPQHEEDLFAATTAIRDWSIVFLGLWSGPRASEILSIKIGGLSRQTSTVWVARKGQGGAYSEIPVPPIWFEFVDAYLAELKSRGVHLADDDFLWRSLRGPDRPMNYGSLRAMFRRIGNRVDLNYTLHDLRHAAATRMANNPEDISLTQVQQILGHASLQTTGHYTRTSIAVLTDALHHHYLRLSAMEANPKPEPLPTLAYDESDLRDLMVGH